MLEVSHYAARLSQKLYFRPQIILTGIIFRRKPVVADVRVARGGGTPDTHASSLHGLRDSRAGRYCSGSVISVVDADGSFTALRRSDSGAFRALHGVEEAFARSGPVAAVWMRGEKQAFALPYEPLLVRK